MRGIIIIIFIIIIAMYYNIFMCNIDSSTMTTRATRNANGAVTVVFNDVC